MCAGTTHAPSLHRMNIPPEFIKTIHNTFGDKGRLWLDHLPAFVSEASHRWKLTAVKPVPNLSYNFVAFADHGGDEVVLKIGVPDRELISEITALRFFDGNGAVRLLEVDDELCMFLLERVKPGEMLTMIEDDDRAMNIAADVMLKLWKPAPQNNRLIKLTDWFKGFDKLRTRFDGGTGPFDKALLERAESAARQFFAEDAAPTLMHGDLHHFNILSSGQSWVAIDPKGVIGPVAYEVGPLLINPWGDVQKISQCTERRIAILSERLGFEREHILKWALVHAVLSAWWSIEEHADASFALACARIFSGINLNS